MRRLLTVAVALVLGLTGCQTSRVFSPGGPAAPPVEDVARMRQQAHDILARWEAAYATAKQPVFIPFGPFEPAVVGTVGSENSKEIADHQFVLDGLLPVEAPAGAQLRWPSGASRTIVALTAAQAFDATTSELRRLCMGCTPAGTVHVTGARLTAIQIQAIDGPVTVPAWEFTLAGYQARLVMPAVGRTEALVPPEAPWDSSHPPAGRHFSMAKSTSDGQKVTVDLVGARDGADKPCGEDYTLEAFTSAHAVVIIVRTRYYHGPPADENTMCNMIGYPRAASVELPEPLGNRVLLEGTVGSPVTVTKG